MCIETIATRAPVLFIPPTVLPVARFPLSGSCYQWGMTRASRPTALQRVAVGVVAAASARPVLVRLARNRRVLRAGYLTATAIGLVWGGALSVGRLEESGGVIVARGCPRWAFGRGGTTIGAVFVTRDNVSPSVLEHEAVHRDQWRRYGLALIPLYLAAGPIASENRFEVAAGLEKGGYR